MIYSRYIIVVILICGPLFGLGQSLNDFIQNGNKEFDNGNYYAAADLYNKALDINNKIVSVQYSLAESYRLNRDYNNAGKWYKKIYRNYPDKFPLSGYWYATMMKYLGKYSKASKAYKKFYKSYRTYDNLHDYIIKAKHEYKLCEKYYDTPPITNNIEIIHPDTFINSVYGEFSPIELDSQMYFSSYRHFIDSTQPSFRSRILIHNWNNDTVYEAFDSTFYDNSFHYSLSPLNKNNELCFTKCPINKDNSDCEIYIASYTSNKLQNIRKLNSNINLAGSNSRHPQLTNFNNQELLVFSSDRSGGSGGYDIWYSFRDKNGMFGECKNAGKKINSRENEITPFYFPEDTTLFFSSTWHDSFGGYDIFSSYGDFKFWDLPENIGLPVNSSYDDLYYIFNHSSKNAFFISNRIGSYSWSSESCCNDIYTYKLLYSLNDSIREDRRRKRKLEKIEKLTVDLELLTPLELFFDNDYPNPESKDSITSTMINELLNDYFIKREEYLTEFTKGLKGREKGIAIEEVNEFFYDEVESGLEDLYTFVPIMEELLSNGKEITLTLKAYSSPLNSKDYNKKLAKRRLNSLYNFLISYNDSTFSTYIDDESLKINYLALGETGASEEISDDLDDVRNSVYNPNAARERRITIKAVTIE